MKSNVVSPTGMVVLIAAIAASLTGCATSYNVKVSSICRPSATASELASYDLRTRTRVADEDRLRYKEAARCIRTALSAKGLYEAPQPGAADMIVEIDYGMEPPRAKQEAFSQAIIAHSGVPTDGRSAMDPAKEVVGYAEVERTVMVREKRLSVCGRENKAAGEGQPPREIWRVDVSIEDESHDLRGYLPVLAAAAMDEIGRTTDGTTEATVRASDSAVSFINKGL